MAALTLKHLLNDDDDSSYNSHQPLVGWDDHGYLDEPLPALPIQSWNEYVHDVFNSATLIDDISYKDQPFAVESESLRETQEAIEQWAAEDASLPSSDATLHIEEALVCFGTVGTSTDQSGRTKSRLERFCGFYLMSNNI
ncbi:hypothetical protein FB567DRAFT_353662 [Paraphoma chrysanthemicola]|uniref:Uncharacterized protein n=1 Tax=Paraphoma chrysanthemicola TaxID=798071 RepID=A0A8K0R8X5_9PLEO|nr:hypothetical protein FB567DRAFT_353662 [Paraphoma chrysanthemicola]